MTLCADATRRSDRAADIRALRAKGATVQSIALHFGVSRSRIYQLAATEVMTAAERAACDRFAMLPADLATRLSHRFLDDDAVCAANDEQLLSIRQLGPQQLQKLRRRYPYHERAAT